MGALRPGLLAVAILGLAVVPLRPAVGADSAAGPTADDALMRKWSRSCALCHVDGNGGAPRVGHSEEWQPRLAQGPEVLLEHTLDGYGRMPPLGYCMACEGEDFRALIEFMSGAGR